jgi:hypothetical protein
MLLAWGFEKVGVVVADLYFVDPAPKPGQEGAERGVRLEVRFLGRPPLTGSVYAAQPIVVDRPIWRADLLETVAGEPGSYDRTHHHPHFRGWEPGGRSYDPSMSIEPIAWIEKQLSDLSGLLAGAGIDESLVGPSDASDLAVASPAISRAVVDLLARVRAGELAQPPDDASAAARVSWL